MGDYLEVSKEKNRDEGFGKEDVLSVSGEFGIVNQIEFQGRSFAGASVKNYGVVEVFDIVYTKSPLKSNPYGIIKTNKGKAGIVSTLYAVYKPKNNVDSEFIQIYFELDSRMNSYMHPLVNKGAKNDMKVSDENALKGPVIFPRIEEQKMISQYFSNLDHLITLHQRKCDQTKNLKKYMLQKMFPQNGAKVPEIRFDGYTYDWEQRKFGELYSKVSEKNDLSFGADKIISVANMYFKEEVKESSDEYMRTYNVMRLGDIAFEGNKSKNYSHGRFVENTIGDGIVSHVFDVFRPTTSYDLLFWKYLINNEGVMGRIMARCTNASTMMTNLVASDFLKEKILVPSLKEQKKIGAYFDSLDHLITLHQRQHKLHLNTLL